MNEYPYEKKVEAVTTFLTLGNMRQVAAVCGVAYNTVQQWKTKPWWKDLEAEIVATRRIATGSKLANIIDKSLDVVDDRLTNGELVLNNKTGELTRKEVSLRDATSAANSLMQRQAILEKMVRDETVAETTVSIEEQLKGLAAEFAKFNNRHKAIATDVAYKEIDDDAVHDKWPERLQEGSGEVHEQAISGEEEDGAERSASGDGEEGPSPQG